MYYERTLSAVAKQCAASFKVLMVTGPRQVGKTTLLKHLMESDRTYVSLDDISAATLAQNDPELFFQMYQPPVFIDEVQRAPQLFPYIKLLVDKSEKRGSIWLSGSQQFSLMQNIAESLAGRVGILDLQGFSISELQRDITRPPYLPSFITEPCPVRGITEIFDAIVQGSYPQVHNGITDRNLFYSSYIRTYLERDVRQLLNISDESAFVTFLKVIASRTGQLINYNDIARDVGKTAKTIKAWMSILQTSGLIYILQPYYNNIGQRAVKTPKFYFMDTGLCCYLCGISSGEAALSIPMSGALFETYVVSEILKSYYHNGQNPHIYFYRNALQQEIDLIIEQNGKLYPVEIKQTGTPTEKMVKNFSVIGKDNYGLGSVICMADKFIPMNKEVYITPIDYI